MGTIEWNQSADGYVQTKNDMPNMKPTASGSVLPNMLCNKLVIETPTNVYNKTTDNTISIASANSRFRIYMSTLAGYTAQQVQTALSGFYVVYPLETPVLVNLPDGTPINTLVGVNNIFADSGDILECKYKDTIQHYIDTQIAATQALIL